MVAADNPNRKKRISQGRRMVALLLFLTILLSFFFWLEKEIPAFLKKVISPYQTTVEKEGR